MSCVFGIQNEYNAKESEIINYIKDHFKVYFKNGNIYYNDAEDFGTSLKFYGEAIPNMNGIVEEAIENNIDIDSLVEEALLVTKKELTKEGYLMNCVGVTCEWIDVSYLWFSMGVFYDYIKKYTNEIIEKYSNDLDGKDINDYINISVVGVINDETKAVINHTHNELLNLVTPQHKEKAKLFGIEYDELLKSSIVQEINKNIKKGNNE